MIREYQYFIAFGLPLSDPEWGVVSISRISGTFVPVAPGSEAKYAKMEEKVALLGHGGAGKLSIGLAASLPGFTCSGVQKRSRSQDQERYLHL